MNNSVKQQWFPQSGEQIKRKNQMGLLKTTPILSPAGRGETYAAELLFIEEFLFDPLFSQRLLQAFVIQRTVNGALHTLSFLVIIIMELRAIQI